MFLLDAGEFFPFGASINADHKIVSRAAYIDDNNDCPPSLELIEMLEKSIVTDIQSGRIILGVVAIDGRIKKDDQIADVIEMRFYELDKMYRKIYQYFIYDSRVEFMLTQ